MAGRKKKDDAASDASTERAFTVVLEDVRAQFKVFGEQLQGMNETFTARFEEMDRRFEQVDRRFAQIDRRFDAVDARFDAVDARFDRIERALERKVDQGEVEAIVRRIAGR